MCNFPQNFSIEFFLTLSTFHEEIHVENAKNLKGNSHLWITIYQNFPLRGAAMINDNCNVTNMIFLPATNFWTKNRAEGAKIFWTKNRAEGAKFFWDKNYTFRKIVIKKHWQGQG